MTQLPSDCKCQGEQKWPIKVTKITGFFIFYHICPGVSQTSFSFPLLPLHLTSYWHSLKYNKPHRLLLTSKLGPDVASPQLL